MPENNTQVQEPAGQNTNQQPADTTGDSKPAENNEPEKHFTQAEVDNLIKSRLVCQAIHKSVNGFHPSTIEWLRTRQFPTLVHQVLCIYPRLRVPDVRRNYLLHMKRSHMQASLHPEIPCCSNLQIRDEPPSKR